MAKADFIIRGPRKVRIINSMTLGENLFWKLQQHGDSQVAVVQQVDGVEESLTYSELLLHAKILAGLLRQHGLGSGDTVMLCCGNTLEYAPIMLATIFVGAALAPVNPGFERDDMLYLIDMIKPQIVISNTQAESSVQEALTQYETPVVFIPMVAVTKRLKENPDVSDFCLGKVDEGNIAFVMCSSGTSGGKPKGVEITQYMSLQMLDMYNPMPPADEPKGERDVFLNLSGPFWVSCQITTLLSLHLGVKHVLLQPFTTESFLRTVQEYKVNITVLSPNALIAIAKFPALDQYDMSSLTAILYAGSPMTRSMLDLALTTMKKHVSVLYAMTECYALLSVHTVTDRPCNVGKLIPNTSAKIVDIDTGELLGPDIDGELCLKTELSFKGYRGNPEATAAMFDDDGFLHTGDMAHYDKDEYFYVVDRIKEMIKYRRDHVTWQVPATDIEEVLLKHTAVLQAAVIGVNHETDWERATAIVVLRPGATVTAQELVTLVEESLPEFKWLHGGVHFVASLPMTPTGKIQKYVLRKQYSKES